ncbi:MAG: hydroxyacylglutathione hydrolase [Pseudomonadota bacterium]
MVQVTPVPAFSDNYIWLLSKGGKACVVDPGDADPVLAALEARNLELTDILITHHHFDHVGGLASLVSRYGPTIYGPENPAIDAITHRVRADDTVEVLDTAFRILEVPGHTLDHIAYLHEGPSPLLFCGDTLFAGGCGRVFEGTFEMMFNSLHQLALLPPDTRVFCAHEYTLANLAFAEAVEPQNSALQSRIADARALREQNIPTVPSDIGTELATNPFLRCEESVLLDSLREQGRLEGQTGPEVFATVRGWKDNF